MNRALLPLLALALVALMVLGAFGRRQVASAVPSQGKPLPPFSVTRLDGGTLTEADLRGKASFLNFWASWCIPCRQEMPLIAEVYRREKARLNVLAIDVQEGEFVIRQFLAETGVDVPVAMDPQGKVFFGWGFRYLPTSVFTDERGTVCRVSVGALSRKAMEAAVREAMGGCA